jgi:hypothetical protein
MYSSKKTQGFGLLLLVAFSACVEKDGAHTTAITHVPPPPHQQLTIVSKPGSSLKPQAPDITADVGKPLLIFDLENGSSFRMGEAVPVSFRVLNAKLKGEGGEFSIRYIVDDGDMQWRYTNESFWLAGWLTGKHTIRVELIGPDGWPFRNGNANVVTREITIEP